MVYPGGKNGAGERWVNRLEKMPMIERQALLNAIEEVF